VLRSYRQGVSKASSRGSSEAHKTPCSSCEDVAGLVLAAYVAAQ
jgi:hypothetical protein